MNKMKAYTDIEQSKKLAEILPIDSADACWTNHLFSNILSTLRIESTSPTEYKNLLDYYYVQGYLIEPAWSLAALLNYIKDKCGYFELVYLSSTIDGRANILKNVYRLSTDVYDVYENELIDACYEMILKLHKQKLL